MTDANLSTNILIHCLNIYSNAVPCLKFTTNDQCNVTMILILGFANNGLLAEGIRSSTLLELSKRSIWSKPFEKWLAVLLALNEGWHIVGFVLLYNNLKCIFIYKLHFIEMALKSALKKGGGEAGLDVQTVVFFRSFSGQPFFQGRKNPTYMHLSRSRYFETD